MLEEGQTVYFIPNLYYDFDKDSVFVRKGVIDSVGHMNYTIVEIIKTHDISSITYVVPEDYVFLTKSEAEYFLKEAKIRLYKEREQNDKSN